MKLYGYFRSSATYRVRIVLHLKNINFTSHFINLRQGEQLNSEWLTLNPEGLVPALEIAPNKLITQSTAIIEWLEEQYAIPNLLPQDSLLRVQARSIAQLIACDIHPLNNLRVLKYLEAKMSNQDKSQWYHHWIIQGFTPLEMQVSSPFCLGEKLSLADIYLIPQVYNAIRFKVDMSFFPKILSIYEFCMSLPYFIQASPERQKDAQ